MKLIISAFFVVAILSVSNSVFGQDNSKIKEVSTMKTANSERVVQEHHFKVDSAKLATKKKDDSSFNYIPNVKDVNYYNHFIEALEVKREYVMNDPEEKAKAEETGWFKKIDFEIAKAKIEREKLLQK